MKNVAVTPQLQYSISIMLSKMKFPDVSKIVLIRYRVKQFVTKYMHRNIIGDNVCNQSKSMDSLIVSFMMDPDLHFLS